MLQDKAGRKHQIHDFVEYWDSYVSDVENNLKMDPDTWEEYLEDPDPFLFDVIMDFGEGLPEDYDECAILVTQLLRGEGKVEVDDKFTWTGREHKIIEVYKWQQEVWVKATHKDMKNGQFIRFRFEQIRDIVRIN